MESKNLNLWKCLLYKFTMRQQTTSILCLKISTVDLERSAENITKWKKKKKFMTPTSLKSHSESAFTLDLEERTRSRSDPLTSTQDPTLQCESWWTPYQISRFWSTHSGSDLGRGGGSQTCVWKLGVSSWLEIKVPHEQNTFYSSEIHNQYSTHSFKVTLL